MFVSKTYINNEIDKKTIEKELDTETEAIVEVTYKTVKIRKLRGENIDSTLNNVEEIINKSTPHTSFHYRNNTKISSIYDQQSSSYMPMNIGAKKRMSAFRFNKEYPSFDWNKMKFIKNDLNDRGYYYIHSNKSKTNEKDKINTTHKLSTSISNMNEFVDIKIGEENLYEDLNLNENKRSNSEGSLNKQTIVNKRFQKIISSFKIPFLKMQRIRKLDEEKSVRDCDAASENYDEVKEDKEPKPSNAPVEDYLEPIKPEGEPLYTEVDIERKDKHVSIFGYLMNVFNKFGKRKETNPTTDCVTEINNDHSIDFRPPPSCSKSNMATRPLPVPIDNEPYYMNINRDEAEKLLLGHPDGTFLLRPSSQPNHAYTLSVSCAGAVHNVGIRRRADNKIALGYARKTERCFSTIQSLLRYHSDKRLLLITDKGVIGATCLKEPPPYYQVPSNLPVRVTSQVPQ